MAYTFVRDVTFQNMAASMRAAPVVQQIVKFYKEAVNVDIQVLRPISGAPTRLRFISQLESLDKWQADTAKVMQDPAFHKLLAEMGPLVDGSKTSDELWVS
jgi:hypothetical protein